MLCAGKALTNTTSSTINVKYTFEIDCLLSASSILRLVANNVWCFDTNKAVKLKLPAIHSSRLVILYFFWWGRLAGLVVDQRKLWCVS